MIHHGAVASSPPPAAQQLYTAVQAMVDDVIARKPAVNINLKAAQGMPIIYITVSSGINLRFQCIWISQHQKGNLVLAMEKTIASRADTYSIVIYINASPAVVGGVFYFQMLLINIPVMMIL